MAVLVVSPPDWNGTTGEVFATDQGCRDRSVDTALIGSAWSRKPNTMTMPFKPLLLVAALAFPAGSAAAQTATSPDGTVSVTFSIDGDGRAAYAVSRKGTPIVNPPRPGFLFTDFGKLERGFYRLAGINPAMGMGTIGGQGGLPRRKTLS